MVLKGHVTEENHYISTTRVPMATKLDKMITYFDGLLPIKSHDSLITWSCGITWKTKTIISPIPQCLDHQTWYNSDAPQVAPHV